MVSPDELLAILKPHGQEHVLAFWDRLSSSGQARLAQQIRRLDLPLIDRLWREEASSHDWAAMAARASGPPAVRLDGSGSAFSPEQCRQRGEQALAAGKVAAVLVAGGQGTRLGFDHPKGMFPIGPVSQATLFQILLEKLLAVGRRYGRAIPLYLMTSEATHEETVGFLQDHGRFSLAAEDLMIFRQGMMPAVDERSGRLLLDQPGELALSPDGHGGMLAALRNSGGLDDVARRGIEQLFYMQVDNPLVSVCDPEFIGHHLLADSEVSTQVVAKRDPLDRVGNVVLVDGKARIIEYSDLPEDAARQRLPDGSLKLWAGSIAVHVFSVSLLERMSTGGKRLPFHRAKKKVPFVDPSGRRIEPDGPNAIKFEQFIFDLLPEGRNAVVFEVDESTNFAPLKNAPGSQRDSPEIVRAQMVAVHTDWLRQAGAIVEPGVPVEISPLFALDAEELSGKIDPGLRIARPWFR